MRLENINDKSRFAKCKDFGITEVVADCIGPLIDISKIKLFHDIEYVRYLNEKEICERMPPKSEGYKWRPDEILAITKEALEHPKLAVRYIDADMVMQLCKAKTFCSIKIVSTVPDKKLFEHARRVLIDFANQMVKYNPDTIANKGYIALVESDFEYLYPGNEKSDLPGILLYYQKKVKSGELNENSYKIAIDDDALVFSTIAEMDEDIPSFQEWIGGIRENSPVKRLEEVLHKRRHIFDGAEVVEKMCENNKIDLKSYAIMDSYYVYDSDLRKKLENQKSDIENIIKLKKSATKPICVFLAGTPGTGKSYFVKCFAKSMKCIEQYPVTSLSGVSSANFYDAIEYHVEQVYNAKYNDEQKVAIAFLDEIDTEGDYFAFRFLMDAMTGSRTNDKGVTMGDFKSGTVENLVWFFAGSAGATRQEFMSQIKEDERKVIDFFDRIHFDMQLPAVENPGQAILTLMSAIDTFWGKNKPREISIKVLLAFACTRWTSTRSIMTICRVAAAHQKADTNETITLELFERIDTSEEFHKLCIYIGEHVKDERVIAIEWDDNEEV